LTRSIYRKYGVRLTGRELRHERGLELEREPYESPF
jgi:hypothetical protein